MHNAEIGQKDHIWMDTIRQAPYDSSYGLLVTDKAFVILFLPVPGVTFSAVVHFHSFPGVCLVSRDIFSPYVDRVSGQAIGSVCGYLLGLCMIPVAYPAVLFAHCHMSNMGEVYAVGLSGIGEPGDLLFGCHVVVQKISFFICFSEGHFRIIVAFGALCKQRDADKRAIIAELMAIEAPLVLSITLNTVDAFRIQMKGVVEVHWLWL